MKVWIFIMTLLPLFSLGQTDNESFIDSLAHVTDMPYICKTPGTTGCGDKIFWRVVQQKESIIPLLIERLADTKITKATVPNFGGYWTTGDIAYAALQEIIKGIPTFELLGVNFDTNDCGYCAYWNYLRRDKKNRIKFQTAVRKWYNKNRMNFIWVTSNEFMTCDCNGQHPNGGHFELKK